MSTDPKRKKTKKKLMKQIDINIKIGVCQLEELSANEQALIKTAIEATKNSYSPYSHFSVGAALLLENGEMVMGQTKRMLPIHRDFVPNVRLFLQRRAHAPPNP